VSQSRKYKERERDKFHNRALFRCPLTASNFFAGVEGAAVKELQ
jgi:hypothetical protein